MKDRPVVGYAPPELARLRERAELQFRRAALVEHRLKALAEHAGLRPDITVLDEAPGWCRPMAPAMAPDPPAAGACPDGDAETDGQAPRPLDRKSVV